MSDSSYESLMNNARQRAAAADSRVQQLTASVRMLKGALRGLLEAAPIGGTHYAEAIAIARVALEDMP